MVDHASSADRHAGNVRERPAEEDLRVPCNLEAERAVLGALMLYADAVGDVNDVLAPEDFYVPKHQLVYRAILEAYDQAAQADPIAVEDRLQRQGKLEEAGGLDYLLDLAQSVVSAAGVVYHANLVREKAILRRLLETCTEIAREAYDGGGSARDLLDDAERRIFEIARVGAAGETHSITELLVQTFARIDNLRSREGRLTGLATGYPDLDDMTAGLQPGELVVIAGRPSMGKTSFALNLVERIAGQGHGVAFFSLEMSSQQIIQNLLCCRAQIDGQAMRKGRITDAQYRRLQDEASELYEAPIYVDDSPDASPITVRAKCRRLKQRHDIKMVVIDYLQLMSLGGRVETRQQEIATISRTLKAIARELKVPVIALSQLNRDAERDNREPRMSDLRESGAIEQDADVIMLLHREDYYRPTDENRGLAQVILAKQRNGPTGRVTFRFFREFMRFESFVREPEPVH